MKPELDPTRCRFDKVLDRSMRFPRPHQCARKPVKDGFCTQHHPDKIKEREEQARARDQERWEKSPFNRIMALHAEIEKLKRDHKTEIHYVLTVQLLHLRRELFKGGGLSREEFDRQHLGGLGRYERRIAKKEGIVIDP